MVEIEIKIPENIYEQIKNKENLDELVSGFLAEYVRYEKIEKAREAFGSVTSFEPDSLTYVRNMRSQPPRTYVNWSDEE